EYHAAQADQLMNEARIVELEDRLWRAGGIDVSKLAGDTIKFGATVTLIDEDTDEKKVWRIVGEPEANAHSGKISVNSPIARALIGRAKGDAVEGFRAPETPSQKWSARREHPVSETAAETKAPANSGPIRMP